MMQNRFLNFLSVVCASLLVAACQTTPDVPAEKVEAVQPVAPEPPATPVAPIDPRAQKEALLADALNTYAEGQFEEAISKLTPLADAQELSLTSQIKARKFMAFAQCALGRTRPCRQQFDLALEQDHTFQLTEAEKGHPVWGREFNNARNSARNKRATRKAH
jgi:hypothetical protein